MIYFNRQSWILNTYDPTMNTNIKPKNISICAVSPIDNLMELWKL